MLNWTEKGYGLIEEIRAQGHWVKQVDGVFVSSDDAAVQAIIDAYDPWPNEIEKKKAEIIEKMEEHLNALVLKKYPRFEVESWPYQKQDAEAFTADSNASTPTLDVIAAQRGTSKAEVVARVLAKAEAFNLLAATYAGERQRIENIIDAMSFENGNTLNDLSAIKFIPPQV